ncbi:MAG: LamG domain-containing protein [Aristaeellaceae bacterium]
MKTRIVSFVLSLAMIMLLAVPAMADYTEGQIVLIDEQDNFSEDAYMFAGEDEKIVFPTPWTEGHHGEGIDFSGVKPHVRFDTTILNGADALTLSTWINLREAAENTLVFGCSGSNGHFKIVTCDAEYGNVMTFAYGLYNKDTYAVADVALPENTWSMVTATIDGTAITLYLNGEVIASAEQDVTPDALALDLFRAASSFWGPPSLNAVMDDASLWTRALSAEEVAALYEATSTAE